MPWINAERCLHSVNNAADGASELLLEATPAHLESSFGVNVYGPLFMTQAVVNIGKMPKGGRIINIGTVVSKMGMALAAVYAAAKAAQDSLTASWAGEVSLLAPPAHATHSLTLTVSLVSSMALRSTHLHLARFLPTRPSSILSIPMLVHPHFTTSLWE